jgi:hypothetical protein
MTRTVRLLSDWGFYPFYVDHGDGFFALTEPDDFRAAFDLPEHVVSALLSWDDLYQAVIDWTDPRGSDWASSRDREHYEAVGRDAARLLRRHLPDDVAITYMAAGDIPPEYY